MQLKLRSRSDPFRLGVADELTVYQTVACVLNADSNSLKPGGTPSYSASHQAPDVLGLFENIEMIKLSKKRSVQVSFRSSMSPGKLIQKNLDY